ncbi:MAG TPA: RpiB/LacA/LacB family sugar-phosphate isomerase [Actinomycetales bacterium]|nr:RpiB/LacA/LacB family sugar-phosphate isomerase [Actinomycetales bacterium]
MRIAIAADHNGLDLKAALLDWLVVRGHRVEDLGTHSTAVVDYPALCQAVGNRVSSGTADFGIVIGGSGQGEVIACNKLRGIRAGLCHTPFATEVSRGHNDANVMVLGAKVINAQTAVQLLDLWMSTAFKGGVHQDRIDQISRLEDTP